MKFELNKSIFQIFLSLLGFVIILGIFYSCNESLNTDQNKQGKFEKVTKEEFTENSGVIKDKRDGQSYRWAKMKDGKNWLIENMNFYDYSNQFSSKISCYNNDNKICKNYGKLYTWEAAKIACPKGWHLPTDDEWWNLISKYGSISNFRDGQKNGGNGKEAYNALIRDGYSGFSALQGGFCMSPHFYEIKEYGSIGVSGYYWSSTKKTESNTLSIFYRFAYHNNILTNSMVERSHLDRFYQMSCRCIQD